MPSIIKLKYGGEKIENQDGMDAYDVADAIDSFSDFLKSLGQANYGTDFQPSLAVRGVRDGSLEIQFVFEAAAVAKSVLDAIGGLDIGEAIKQAIALLKHLQGSPPKSTFNLDHGSVQVENNNGQIIVVNQPVINAIFNGDASQSSERFMRKPLRNDAEEVEIDVDGEQMAKASRKDADSFVPIGKEEALTEFTSEQYLTVQTVVLEGDGQWRFSDGRNKFRAEIADKSFLSQVRNGRERFGRGDILKVKLKSKQEKIRGQLRTVHVVDQVLSHEPYGGTGQLSFL